MFKKVFNFFLSMFQGHFTVMKNAFRKRVTLEYPEKKKALNPRFRGKLLFVRNNDGSPKCSGCGMCQKVCPCKDLIKIERTKDESGKFKVTKYEVDMARCIFCGNCVENCPTKSLKMSKSYTLASLNKDDLILTLKGI
ncbi:MAG: NADH-quinone oxidoreductase subunit I [Candidatus Gastranaerophilales bacterium]|nr:NADH-quinone oxidoreductase subunit I [Candidatus Gastranaerophilales bacterium]